MRQASERPTSDPFQEELANCDGAALVIDPRSGAVLTQRRGLVFTGHPTGSRLPTGLARLRDAGRVAAARAGGRRLEAGHDPDVLDAAQQCQRSCQVSLCGEGGSICLVRPLKAVLSRQPEPAPPTEKDAAQPMRDVALRSKLAHELRTPLGAVIAYAEILKDEHFGPDGLRPLQGLRTQHP